MKYLFSRFKEIISSKRARYILIGLAIFIFLGSLFRQESSKISFKKAPMYKVDKSDFEAIEYVENVVDTVSEFITEGGEVQTPAIVSSSPSTYDAYYSYSGVASAEDSATEIYKLNGLPYVLQNIPSSSGLDVGARISNPPYSDQSILIIEISGPNYFTSKPTDLQNPNVVAFRDGFIAVKNELSSRGVDINKIRFNLGTRGDQMGRATSWLNFLKLIP